MEQRWRETINQLKAGSQLPEEPPHGVRRIPFRPADWLDAVMRPTVDQKCPHEEF